MTYTWPVLIALNRCDHIEEAVTHIKGLAEERPISWTTWTRTLDFFIDALDEQDVARFEAIQPPRPESNWSRSALGCCDH